MDDNIRCFKRRVEGKNKKADATPIIEEVEEYLSQYSNIAQLGLSHAGFAFAKKNDIDFNKQIYSCMLIKSSIDARFEKDIIEDTDFSLQCLYRKYVTVLFNRLLIDKVTTGVMKGGNTEIEHGDKSKLRTDNLVAKYPGTFKNYEDQKGRWRIRPSRIWKTFVQKPEI